MDALVSLQQPVFIIKGEPSDILKWKWELIISLEKVPDEFRRTNTGDKFLAGLLPNLGVIRPLWHIDKLKLSYLQTIEGFEAMKSALQALCHTALQNGMALDIMLAKEGSARIMFNETCCTYILDEENLTDIIARMRQVQGMFVQDQVAPWNPLWWF